MGLIEVFKAGLVGSLGVIMAIGLTLSLLGSASKLLQQTSIKVHKFSSFITLIVVWIVGWGAVYWYFSSNTGVTNPSELTILTIFACLFALTPSFAMVGAALTYYFNVQKVVGSVSKKQV